MKYKGYVGTIEIDEDEKTFHGEVIGITDLISYEGKTTGALVKSFHAAVDEYLSFCAERGEEPEKPYSGKFVVRISPELHCLAATAARTADESLNSWVKMAIESALSSRRDGGQSIYPASAMAGPHCAGAGIIEVESLLMGGAIDNRSFSMEAAAYDYRTRLSWDRPVISPSNAFQTLA